MKVSHNFDASGWVGHNSLNVRVDQQDSRVKVDGWMGSSSVHLEERDGRVDGYLSSPNGFIDVNVQIDRGSNGLSYSRGWVGRDSFRLDCRPSGSRYDVSGWVGNNRIDLTRADRPNSSDFTGWINAGGGLGENVNVRVTSAEPLSGAAMESIYPLLGLTGAALKASLAP